MLLIVENDLAFARLLLEAAREKGFKGLVTSLGAAALALTSEYKPDAITLDICLPDIDGWRVLDRLKNDMTTRHIPVCVISTEDGADRGCQLRRARGADQADQDPRDAGRSCSMTIRELHRPAASRTWSWSAPDHASRERASPSRSAATSSALTQAATGEDALDDPRPSAASTAWCSHAPPPDMPIDRLLASARATAAVHRRCR